MNDPFSLSRRVFSALLLTFGLLIGFALAASIGRADQPPPPADGERGDHPKHPLLLVFDTNHDGVLDAAEVEAASAVLRAYDADRDGVLELNELVEALPPPPHRGPGVAMGRGGEHEHGGERPLEGGRPPRG